MFEKYLNSKGVSLIDFSKSTKIPVSTLRNLNKLGFKKWKIKYIEVLSNFFEMPIDAIFNELKTLTDEVRHMESIEGRYDIENRRYIGNKNKLIQWITNLMDEFVEGKVFFDVFSGTGVVSKNMLEKYDQLIINDFLFSNEVIYHAFFGSDKVRTEVLKLKESEYQNIDKPEENYFSMNYGDKFFSRNDAKVIGAIRDDIDKDENLRQRERYILLASLIYSSDKVSNTVGHYDAYRKKVKIEDKFKFELIRPLDTSGKKISIFREDANELVKKVSADVAFIDPPYNSRQYSRFYHVLENLTKWDKPKLEGVAMKPPAENMSEYSKSKAPEVFDNLIKNINAKYIVVTYNNTYNSKSSSSRNKITHEEIITSLSEVGKTRQFEKPYKFFNTGKTELKEHKEFVFITEVGVFDEK
ncbi:DNA adenine methylase [Streptococcus gallolyticus subsp. gallolyticus]|uniref:DNA adenine methylase n=1 Tax=Streptococcus gallolyticus TaxID=315405 RepID=UPI002284E633|nr:DNA adenine methylase [Streptococcus gallolyticus]MCY7201841.1 DNA adenine methylase [Streptococcus gallolyticus subsp. gallolyticus]